MSDSFDIGVVPGINLIVKSISLISGDLWVSFRKMYGNSQLMRTPSTPWEHLFYMINAIYRSQPFSINREAFSGEII